METTFELQITPHKIETKSAVLSWLNEHGFHEYVEGALDTDIDFDYSSPTKDLFAEHANGLESISLYRFDTSDLNQIKASLESEFPGHLDCQILEQRTKDWQEGWKLGFKPIETDHFYIRQPWHAAEGSKQEIIIDPGMAFGTGQHATTIGCLKLLEKHRLSGNGPRASFLDVGCGSGILSIAAHHLGFGPIDACDIDPNAMQAVRENSALNQVALECRQGSVHLYSGKQFDCVVANILAVVLREIILELKLLVAPGGCLVLSGILDDEAPDFISSLNHGFMLSDRFEGSGWQALKFKRK